MDAQNKCYREIPTAYEPDEGQQARQLQASGEFGLLGEAKDILDELQIMRDINRQQVAVLKRLGVNTDANIDHQKTHRSFFLHEKPRARKEALDDLTEKAHATYKAIVHLIDIKQKQASLYQAMSTLQLMNSTNTLLMSSNAILHSTKALLESNNKLLDSSNALQGSNNEIMASTKLLLESNREVHKTTSQMVTSMSEIMKQSERSGETAMTVRLLCFPPYYITSLVRPIRLILCSSRSSRSSL